MSTGPESAPPAASRPHVSVVVPVRNGAATIERCIESLLNDPYPDDRREIVVVDNGSTDGTAELVRGHPIRLLAEPEPGLSRARNRGIEESEGEIVAFTDADCCVSTGWLGELIAGLEGDGVDAVTAEVVPFPPTTAAERYSARRKPSVVGWQEGQAEPWFCFMNTAVRREAFDRVGSFDPSFAGVGCEDIDFAWRFADAGLRVRRQIRPVVFHRQRITSRDLFRQNLRNGRGWALLHRRHPHRAAWSARRELGAWGDIGRTAFDAARARLPMGRTEADADADYRHLDLVLKLGQRLGFVEGRLRGLVR